MVDILLLLVGGVLMTIEEFYTMLRVFNSLGAFVVVSWLLYRGYVLRDVYGSRQWDLWWALVTWSAVLGVGSLEVLLTDTSHIRVVLASLALCFTARAILHGANDLEIRRDKWI